MNLHSKYPTPLAGTASQVAGLGNLESGNTASDVPRATDAEVFNSRAGAREALEHLRNAQAELGYLRRRNEVLEAQLRIVTVFEAVAIGRQAAMMPMGMNGCGTATCGGGNLDYFLQCHEAGERENRESKDNSIMRGEIDRLAEWIQANAGEYITEGSAVDVAIKTMDTLLGLDRVQRAAAAEMAAETGDAVQGDRYREQEADRIAAMGARHEEARAGI